MNTELLVTNRTDWFHRSQLNIAHVQTCMLIAIRSRRMNSRKPKTLPRRSGVMMLSSRSLIWLAMPMSSVWMSDSSMASWEVREKKERLKIINVKQLTKYKLNNKKEKF